MTSTVKLEIDAHVARVTLNRPDVANTLNLQMGRDLLQAALSCENDPAVRAVILTGEGRNFCFGGDLRGMMGEGGQVEAYLNELTTYLHAAIASFTRMSAPVIAAVNGTAAGAGVGLVAMADLAVAGQSSKFALAYTGVGLTPDGSTSFLLPRVVGRKRAMELFLTNRTLGAEEALAWGLVNQVVADETLLETAGALATRLAAGPTAAFGAVKRLMLSADAGLESQMATEGRAIAAQAASPEGTEGINAFLEKRKPKFG
ncbi:MAG TPA: enoyl-CoA hydratase/isomerase family protein [Steroidobacteraceae bacterium]|nr:enoyl-CoA hydratase/isomerase family protein [Steroidobacteraceae bacterium]